mgnify:CR=1 FL=1
MFFIVLIGNSGNEIIGTASVARGYSNYVDSLVNGTVQANLRYYMPIDVPGLSAYPDFLAFLITFSLTSNFFLIIIVID